MMNIVIVGAGELGHYLASILSKDENNITVIDNDQVKIEAVSQRLDIGIRYGSGTDWKLLEELFELEPDLILAVTNDDETNLVTCAIAKNLGYPRTMARVHDSRYLDRSRLDFGQIFDVDYFVGPELLVANDILKYLISPGSLFVENFVHGAVQLRTVAVPESWPKFEKPLSELHIPSGVMIGLIKRDIGERERGILRRKKQVIFPHGGDHLLPGDEVTFIGETAAISQIHHFLGLQTRPVNAVVIVGGSPTAVHLARLLENTEISAVIIEKDLELCRHLSESLPKCTVMNHDGTDIDFLKAEKVGEADVFIACTSNDEVNMMVALLGKDVGCDNALALIANSSYASIASQMGINYTFSPKISAANHILSRIYSGTVRSLVSLYENQAEIMELNVSMDSSVIGIPLSELGPMLPKDFLIAMIQNRGRVMIANGDRIISAGDTVIVVTNPKHIPELKQIF